MNRRTFVGTVGAAAFVGPRFLERPQSTEGFITDVAGIKVGHFTDPRRPRRFAGAPFR